MKSNYSMVMKTDFFACKKTQELINEFGDAGAFKLMRLWKHVIEEQPDGDLSEWPPWLIEKYAGWTGNKGRFFLFLCSTGFLDGGPGRELELQDLMNTPIPGLKAHDWWENAGMHLYARALKNKRRVTKEEFGFTGNRTGSGKPSRQFSSKS